MKLFNIPITIDPSFFLVTFVLASGRLSKPAFLIEWGVVVFVSILVHELGHAGAVRACGLSPRITLYSLGGVTSWTGEKHLSPPKLIGISLAGPVAGFLFGGAVIGADWAAPDLFATRLGRIAYQDLLWVNLGWGLFNLAPVLPLDGGHVVAHAEQWIRKRTDGMLAYIVSVAVSAGLAIWAFSTGWSWVALMMLYFVFINGQAIRQLRQARRDEPLQWQLRQAQEAVERGDGDAAARQAREILRLATSDAGKRNARQTLLQGLILADDSAQAKEELNRLMAFDGADAVAEAMAGLGRAHVSRAIPWLELAYNQSHAPSLALLQAQALLLAGRPGEAPPWIERAVEAGFRDLDALESNPDFEALRTLPEFEAIRGRLRPSTDGRNP